MRSGFLTNTEEVRNNGYAQETKATFDAALLFICRHEFLIRKDTPVEDIGRDDEARFASHFLLDLWLSKGKQASEVLAELQALAGPSYYNRIDIRFAREGYERIKTDTLARLGEQAPEALAGRPVVERQALDTNDGFKFHRDDGSWLLIRFSGTEALLRIYVEARTPEDVDALLAEGRRIAVPSTAAPAAASAAAG